MPFFDHNFEYLQSSSKDIIIGLASSFERVVRETDAMTMLVNAQIGDSGYASDYVEEVIIDAAINKFKGWYVNGKKRLFYTICA